MRKERTNLFRSLLCLLMLWVSAASSFAASELPLLTTDTSDPILYRIKNTRRTAKGTANYWTPTSLTTSQASATQVYFTGTKTGATLQVKIHLKGSEKTLTNDFAWGEGIDWYIKQFTSAQGGTDATTGSTYKGVIISNASTFPNVTGDKVADDGLGCWYVGSSNTAAWLYGGQWDGSIFTMEIVDPSRIPEEDPTASSLIVNNSFEEGDLTGWVYGSIGGDHFVKPNTDEVFTTSGVDGDYLFNTWYSADGYIADTQNQCVYQTIRNLPVGEYTLSVLASSNAKQTVTLFANDFTLDFVPAHKSSFDEQVLESIFITEDVRSLTIGLRSCSWFRADNFKLVSLGETAAYKAYVNKKYADASVAHPVMFDAFDGQETKQFTYKEIGAHTHGGYPIATGGVQNDRTMVDRSKMQNWTGNSYQLGNADTYVSYTDLPNGYYRISSEVRVYDLNGDYTGSATGLSIYGNTEESPITTGTNIAYGSNSGKGFYGDYNVICQVTDGKLEAGLRINGSDFSWLGWQNFRIEYIGQSDPGADYLNLDLKAGEYAALCLPYDLKPSYFGQTYTIAQIADNKAVLIPADEVAAGTPCVVKATGEKNVTASDVKFNFNTPAPIVTLWDNAMLQGDLETHTWTATTVTNKTVKPSALTYVEADLANMNFTATIENNAANRFWAQNPNYSTSSSTVIEKYTSYPTYGRRDQPNPIQIPVVKKSAAQTLSYARKADFSDAKTMTVAANATVAPIYNLMPGFTYYYKTADGKSAGQFTVGGTLRMIQVGSHVYNMRDLGGKKTVDGRYVKYGKLFRNGEMNGGYVATSEELQIMRDMGVCAEVDLRNEESGTGISAFGFTEEEGTFYAVRGKNYIADGPSSIDKDDAHLHWKNEFLMILNNLRNFRGVDFHCRIGADRTGMVAILLEGLLGVKEADMLRDYETTTFSTAAGTRLKNVNGFDNLLNTTFKANIPTGGTLRDAFDKFFINTLGISKTDIEDFRNLVLADDPTADAESIEMLSAIEVLKAAIKDAGKYQIGEGSSKYSCTNEAKLEAYNKAIKDAEDYMAAGQYDQATINQHVNAVNTAAADVVAYLKLNAAVPGMYYLKSTTYGSYISCASEADAEGYTRFPMVSTPNKYCIFQYDGTKFINYMTGLCFSQDPIEYGNGIGDRSNMTAVAAEGAPAITVKASGKNTIASYNLYTPKAVLLLKSAGNNLDGFSDWLSHTDSDCIFEEVSELPDPDEKEPLYYRIVSKKSGHRVVDVETQNPSEGRGLILMSKQASNVSQHWMVKRVGEYYMFLSRLGGWAINDPTTGETTATTNTGTQMNIAVADETQQSQLWQFVAQDGEYGNLINVATQHTLNVNGGTDADGTTLISYKSEPDGGNKTSENRQWMLEAVEEGGAGSDTIRTDSIMKRLSDVPHLYIYTKNNASITSKKVWLDGEIYYVNENDEVVEYKALKIRARGNSTYSNGSAYKMPYRVKFDEPVQLLGPDRANARNWALMANAYDKSMMRNALTAELSDFVGLPFSHGAKFVDVSVNGIYAGTYQITDHPEAAPGRLELPEEGSGTDVSYYLECDGYAEHNVVRTATKNVPVRIHKPKDGELTTAQKNYVKSFMDDFEARLFGDNFKDPQKGYRCVVDSTTLADWYIADEISANVDGFWSQYFYKKSGDQHLYFGPLWDADIAYANDNRKGDTSEQLMKDVAYELDHNGAWVNRMWEDPWFQRLINRRYQELVEAGLQTYMINKIDSLAKVLDGTQQVNYAKYGYGTEVLRQRLLHNNYADYVADLKTFINTRVPFLTGAFAKLDSGEAPIPEADPTAAFEADGKSYYQIKSTAVTTKDMLFDAYQNAKVRSWVLKDGRNTQLWVPAPVGDAFMLLTDSLRYAIYDAYTEGGSNTPQLLLAVPDATDNTQLWQFVPQGYGFDYNLVNVATGRYAYLKGGSLLSSNGNTIVSSTVSDPANDAQAIWTLTNVGAVPSDIITAVAPVVLTQGTEAIYDLSGRRVLVPARGLYIKGGKKVVVK